MNTAILEGYCEQYQWNDVRDSMKKLEANPEIRIGFLGEFSSGKSTLINGLLREDLLPTGNIPITKRITEIRFSEKHTTPRFFLRNEPETELSLENFKSLAGNSSRNAPILVTHPPVEPLRSGFSLIDTPGLMSLDSMDADITFGFLPFLDGAIICIDCMTGSVGRSVIDFLNKPEVRPMAEYFIFALTRADCKSPSAREKIREHVIELLQTNVYSTCPESVPDRVVLTSVPKTGNPAMAKDSAFFTAWSEIFISRAQAMHARRHEAELEKIRAEMLTRLESLKTLVAKDVPDVSAQLRDLENQREALRENQRSEEHRLKKMTCDLENAIATLIQSYRNRLPNTRPDELQTLCEQFFADLNNTLVTRLQDHFNDTSELSQRTGAMADSLRDHLNKLAEPGFLEQFANGLLTALLPTILANPIGGGIAGLIKVLGGILSSIGVPTLLSTLFGNSKLKELDAFLGSLPARIGLQTKMFVEELYETEVFRPLENRAADLRRNINQLRDERENSARTVEEQRRALEQAIADVRNA